MEKIIGIAGVEMHMLFDEVFIGLITDSGYNEDVAYDFLDDLHKEFTIFYKNNLGFIRRQ